MKKPSLEIDGAEVLFYSTIDTRHERTGNTKHWVCGKLFDSPAGLAICRYEDNTSYYLFYCNSQWETVTDTCHESLEAAMKQAEFEYKDISQTWENK